MLLMKKIHYILACALYLFPNLSFAYNWQEEGERLTYEVKFAFITAGKAEIAYKPNIKENTYHLISRAWTNDGISALLNMADRLTVEGKIEGESMPFESSLYEARLFENDYKAIKNTLFDHKLLQASYTNVKDGTPATVRDFPNQGRDLFSALYFLRKSLENLTVGSVHSLPVMDMTRNYTLNLKILGREKMKTPWGKKRVIKLQPVMKGLSEKRQKDDLFIWVTDDENRIPVRFQIRLAVGSFNAYLIKADTYKSPSKAPENLPETGPTLQKEKKISYVDRNLEN